jgi:hypothetical protein
LGPSTPTSRYCKMKTIPINTIDRINLKTNKNKRSIKDLSFSRKKKRLRRLMAKPSLFPTL